MWPLNYYFFNEWHLKTCLKAGFRNVHVVFGIAMIFIISPILTYFYGKLVLFLGLWLWRFGKRLVIVIDIYPVRQTHPGKLNDG
jgi:hypothetical protein